MTKLYQCNKCGEVEENVPVEFLNGDGQGHLCRDCNTKFQAWLSDDDPAVIRRE